MGVVGIMLWGSVGFGNLMAIFLTGRMGSAVYLDSCLIRLFGGNERGKILCFHSLLSYCVFFYKFKMV